MGQKRLINLRRNDIDPAFNNQIFFAVNVIKNTVMINVAQIAGHKITISKTRFVSRLIVVVTLEQARAFDSKLSLLSLRHLSAVIIENFDVHDIKWFTDATGF